MPRKRRDSNVEDNLPRKRTRKELRTGDVDFFVPEPADADDASDASDISDADDYAVVYKEDGSRRAESEARRQWNHICDYVGCGQRFNRPCRLEAHKRSHLNLRPFICHHNGCDKTFPRKDHLNRHLKNAHVEVDSNFPCSWPGCGKAFSSQGRLSRHREVHESKYYCTSYPPCNAVFRKEKTLEAHVQMEHLGAKPFPCTMVDPETGERCTMGYQTESALRRHIGNAHEKKTHGSYICMICIPAGTEYDTVQNDAGDFMTIPKEPLSFDTQAELTAHTREVHKPTCSKCGQVFNAPSNLQSHLQTVHADPASRPQFHCPRPGCNSVFARRSNLNVHIANVHDQQYKFFCTPDAIQTSKHDDIKNWDGANACGDPFKAKSSLEQHIRTHHLGLQNRKAMRKAAKPRKKKESNVLSHLTGVGYEEDRDIPCLVQGCEYRFFRDVDLRRHLRSAEHKLTETEVNEMILERDAMTGGQFWIGGLPNYDPLFESVDPSGPHTPTQLPYFDTNPMHGMHKPAGEDYGMQMLDPNVDPSLDMHIFNDNDDEGEEMDKMMGLTDLPRAVEANEGLQWDMLVPVQQFNSGGMLE